MTKTTGEPRKPPPQKADDEFRQAWWWFDPAHATEKCEAALAWETIRRTKSYPALWRKAVKAGLPPRRQNETARAANLRRDHLFQQLRQALPRLFDFLANGFDPKLNWLQLQESQRLTARGYVFGKGQDGVMRAFIVNPEFTLPRQTIAAPPFPVVIGRCQIASAPPVFWKRM